MAGKAQKPGDQLVFQRGGRARPMTAITTHRDTVPDIPRIDMQKSTEELWDRVWRSRVAVRWDEESDMPQIEQLFWSIDERDRARRAFRRKRVVEGSQGQAVLNPLANWIAKLDRTIAQICERLGMTPLDRMRLGITFFEGKSRAQELMESFEDDREIDDDADSEIIDVDAM